jgi:GT2 family glycosyltransferase
LEALAAQTSRVDRVVAVDTGSTDGSAQTVARALGKAPLQLPSDTPYGTAVTAALEAMPAAGADEWIWLLHDDSAPAPTCLAELRAVAEVTDESTAVLGPKLREWPTLRRLLEVGVTVTGTGRRETGLEPGEPDQGQHDQIDRVLAVNTAGMLVRRDVLEYFGLAKELPLFANDLDFGWRLAARSLQTHVVPTAVVFHAEAAYRGRRDAELARHHRRDARAAEMFVVLANGSPRWHPVRLVRMFMSGLLRAFGFSLVRAFSDAKAELAALRIVYGSPMANHRARKERQAAATADSRELNGLLAPVWMPWRHGLDFVIDFVRAVAAIAADSGRARLAAESAKGPLGRRILASPTSYVLLLTFLVALIAERSLLGPGPIQGGALLHAPSGPGHWWSLWWSSWHWVGAGSASAGPPYALPMAVASSIGFGQPGLIVWLIFGMGVPLAGLGAWRLAVKLNLGPWAQAWLCGTYAMLPVALGAISGGHLGTMVVAILLPWLGRALLGLVSPSAEARERSAWRLVLLGGLAACFAPIVAVFLTIFALAAPWMGITSMELRRRLAIAFGPWLLILPWLITAVRSPGSVLMEAGAAVAPSQSLGALDLLTGSLPGNSHIPAWLLMGVPLAAAVALVRPATRPLVLRCWSVAALCAVVAFIYSLLTLDLPGRTGFVPYVGVPVLIEISALLVAAVCATAGLREVVVESSFGARQLVVALVALFALLAPVTGVVAWLSTSGDNALNGNGKAAMGITPPQYIADLAAQNHDQATLILTGGGSSPKTSAVNVFVQRSPVVLGDEAVLALTSTRDDLGSAVRDILSTHPKDAAQKFAAAGIGYVYAPSPVNSQLAGEFDAARGFSNTSTPDPATRAWRVVPTSTNKGLPMPGIAGEVVHRLAVLLQLVLLLAVTVLAAPGRATEGEGA